MNTQTLKRFRTQVQDELDHNIIPFWLTHCVDKRNGGFIAGLSDDGQVDRQGPKGVILNARLLWTFSALARTTRRQDCAEMADYAYAVLTESFWDAQYGGVFWRLGPDGRVLDAAKKTYGQAFAIYALAEYYLFRKTPQAMDKALRIFDLLETNALDHDDNGYYEVMERDWTLADVQQLSDEDIDAPKSMNTHLHLLEAFTHLCAVCREPLPTTRLADLLRLFDTAIRNPQDGHLGLFFDRQWNALTPRISFGHEIEAAWLMYRAAETLGDAETLEQTARRAVEMAQIIYIEGLDGWNGLLYEADGRGQCITDKHFWCQAEAMVGFLSAYQLSGRPDYLETAWKIWEFIDRCQIDKVNGEWFWKVDRHGQPDRSMPKISEWKCPYHNVRACLETTGRLDKIIHQAEASKRKSIYEQEHV